MRFISGVLAILFLTALSVGGFAQNAGTPPPAEKEVAPANVTPLPGLPAEAPKDKATEATKRPDPADTKVSMSFDKADVISVVKFISTAAGVPIVCDPALTGNVTIVSQKEILLCDAYEVVNAALRVRGFLMVGTLTDKVIRVTSLKKAVSDHVTVLEGNDPGQMVPSDNMVTQVIPLSYISALKLKEDLKSLIDETQASCVAITTTNTLIVTDNAGNVKRVAEIIRALDKDTSDVIEVEVYRCKFSSADNLAETLTQIYQLKPAGAPGQQPQQRQEGQPQQVKTDDGIMSLKGEIRLAPDARTNSLIISASKEKIKLVLDTLKKLDVDTEPEVKSKVYPLTYADANMVATQLNNLFEQPQGGVDSSSRRNPWDYWYGGGSNRGQSTGYAGLKRNVIVADVRTNSVIVTATEQNLRAFDDMIKELDAPKVMSEIMRIFQLKYATATELADSLNRLFRGESRRSGSFFDMMFGGSNRNQDEGSPLSQLRNITVVAEEKTNSLLITGPPQSFTAIEKMIELLDKRTPQIYIEVAIVDVTLNDDTKFGVEWSWLSGQTNPDGTPKESASTNFDLAKQTLGLKYSIISDNLKAMLRALETRSDVKVYSVPRITTADNVEATISIGSDQPFISSEQQTNSGNFIRTVDFKNVAVALTVTPHVNGANPTDGESRTISLDVLQTINEIIGREPELNAPIIANRRAETSIIVKDGQTIVIGGIIKENKERVTSAVPIISRIPLIGELFKSRSWKNTKSELMVFLTPHILIDDDAVSEVTEGVKNELSNKPKDGDINTGVQETAGTK